MHSHFASVDLAKAYRLINHGPTVLVSAHHAGVDNVMAAAWCCALDFDPPKVTLVLDKSTCTRELIEHSGRFAVQVPTVAQLALVNAVGNHSLRDEPEKLSHAGVELFQLPDQTVPLLAGCSAWLVCDLINEPHNQSSYDLFIGQVVAAWADDRVFRDGCWHFEDADPAWRSLHHVAGGHYYAIGEALKA